MFQLIERIKIFCIDFMSLNLADKLGTITIFVYFLSFFSFAGGLMYSVWLGVIALIIKKFKYNSKILIGNKVLSYSILYFFCGTVLIDIINLRLSRHISAYDRYSYFLMYFVLLNFIKDRRKLYFYFKLWIFSMFLSFFGIIKYLPDIVNKGRRLRSFYGIMIYSHILAIASTMLLSFLLLMKKKEKKLRNSTFVLYLLTVIAVLFTKTRGAWLAVMIPQSILFLIFIKKTYKYLIMVILTIFFVYIALPQRQQKSFKNRFISIIDTKSNSSNLLRIEFWRASIYTFLKKPLIGTGINGSAVYYKEFFIKDGKLEWVKRKYGKVNKGDAHNSYLALLSRHGIPVGVYFITFMLIIFPYIWVKNYRYIKKRDRRIYMVLPFASFSFYISCITEDVITARTANLYILILFIFSFLLREDLRREKT